MFSVRQKQKIAENVQRILRETNHPELPRREIQFSLHVDGAESWSWADIKNNGAVSVPSINPWNEAQAQKCTPPEPQHSRESDKVKPLAQYLAEYLAIGINRTHKAGMPMDYTEEGLKPILEQAFDAYQSTENVTIKIERK